MSSKPTMLFYAYWGISPQTVVAVVSVIYYFLYTKLLSASRSASEPTETRNRAAVDWLGSLWWQNSKTSSKRRSRVPLKKDDEEIWETFQIQFSHWYKHYRYTLDKDIKYRTKTWQGFIMTHNLEGKQYFIWLVQHLAKDLAFK